MKINILRLPQITLIIFSIITGCKKEIIKPNLNFIGTWTASYSFTNDFASYHWTAKLTLNSDGTAHATHQPGNPIIPNQQVDENFKWGIIDDHTIYLRSLNWSETRNTMNYEVREYSNTSIIMEGFDDNLLFWHTELRK